MYALHFLMYDLCACAQLRENIACDPPLTIVICKRLRQHSKAKIAGHQLIHERRHRTECYTTMQIF